MRGEALQHHRLEPRVARPHAAPQAPHRPDGPLLSGEPAVLPAAPAAQLCLRAAAGRNLGSLRVSKHNLALHEAPGELGNACQLEAWAGVVQAAAARVDAVLPVLVAQLLLHELSAGRAFLGWDFPGAARAVNVEAQVREARAVRLAGRSCLCMSCKTC